MSDGSFWFGLLVGAGGGAWIATAIASHKEDDYNKQLRNTLSQERALLAGEIRKVENRGLALEEAHSLKLEQHNLEVSNRTSFFAGLHKSFENGYIEGRKWLAQFLSEAEKALDETIAVQLKTKKRPALKAADEVLLARSERRQYKEKVKLLEYQLQSLREYFPFIEDYEDAIYDENYDLNQEIGDESLTNSDQALRFLSKTEYQSLPSEQRNQLALERYLNGKLSPQRIGQLYERYVGYLYEKEGWTVQYHGIDEGLQDLGRDLICTAGNQIIVVQAKCWAEHKPIRERHIFQLFGTTQLLKLSKHASDGDIQFQMQLVTSSTLSDVATNAAENLGVLVWSGLKLDKSFPLIKCNINPKTKERIYHLPFDQQYEKVKITKSQGEFWALTCKEAEEAGFRRAFRFAG